MYMYFWQKVDDEFIAYFVDEEGNESSLRLTSSEMREELKKDLFMSPSRIEEILSGK